MLGMMRRVTDWIEERMGIGELVKPLMDHLVPRGSSWLYVFGSATLFAFILQVVTGVALSFTYIPSTSQAYQSLKFITDNSSLDHFLRAVHYFGASAMVVLVGLHMIRTFLFASYKYPREASWMSGTVLAFLTIAMAFTGQILRWDQTAIWTVVVGAQQAGYTPVIGGALARFMLAGETLGAQTLSQFFALHVFVLPVLIALMLGPHLWMVVRNGISEPPKRGKPVNMATYKQEYHEMLKHEGVPFWPDAAWRDVVFAVFMIVVVIGLAIVMGPPHLAGPPDPTNLITHPKPDWYLLWYFSVLALVPHFSTPYVIIGGPAVIFAVMFFLPLFARQGERHPLRRPWTFGVVSIVIVFVIAMTSLAGYEPWSPRYDAPPLPTTVVGTVSAKAQAGAQLFHDKGCEECHRIANYGGFRGPNLTYVGNRLSAQELTWRIANGGHNMPKFANILSAKQMDELVAFLQSRKPKLDASK
jgi:ubiquinol-cytochrome c reductase cytochrome b subunit